MAASKVRAVYTSDQRNLLVTLWASRKGGTDYRVVWRYCSAGEESLREVVLLSGHWPNTLAWPWQGIRALASLSRALMSHEAAKEK